MFYSRIWSTFVTQGWKEKKRPLQCFINFVINISCTNDEMHTDLESYIFCIYSQFLPLAQRAYIKLFRSHIAGICAKIAKYPNHAPTFWMSSCPYGLFWDSPKIIKKDYWNNLIKKLQKPETINSNILLLYHRNSAVETAENHKWKTSLQCIFFVICVYSTLS